MPEDYLGQDTKFNAGVDIALDISTMFKRAAYFSSISDYPNWHRTLETLERRMWGKLKDKKDAREEIGKTKTNGKLCFEIYMKKKNNGKKIKTLILNGVNEYLVEYEKALIYWRDKFGYGMPLKDDRRKAAWN